MSIESRQILMNSVYKILADKITAAEMVSVMDSISVELSHYSVERHYDDDIGMGFNEMLDAFLSAKKVEGRARSTIQRYEYILGKLRDDTSVPIKDYTVYTLRSWLSKEQGRGVSDRTLKGCREVFSSFFGWLYSEGLMNSNPCANIGPIRYQKKVLHPYSDIDLECLKENCKCVRDRAIISFLLSTGCRISEVCNLDRDSIDFRNLECTVLGKGNKERVVFIDNITAMLLKRYFSERTDMCDALFIGKGSERLTPGGVRAMLKRTANRAHVEHVHPHRFRRTLATSLIDHGMQIQDVASILGHEKLDTTMTYVYIDKNNVKNAYRKYA